MTCEFHYCPNCDRSFAAEDVDRGEKMAILDVFTLHPAAEWTEADGEVLWRVIPSDRLPLAADITEMRLGSQMRAAWNDRYPYWSRIPKVQLPAQPKEAK